MKYTNFSKEWIMIFYLEIKIDSIDFNPERMVMISSNIDSKLYTSTIWNQKRNEKIPRPPRLRNESEYSPNFPCLFFFLVPITLDIFNTISYSISRGKLVYYILKSTTDKLLYLLYKNSPEKLICIKIY